MLPKIEVIVLFVLSRHIDKFVAKIVRKCIQLNTKWIFWMNVYLFNFYDVYLAIIEKNISKKKGVFIS